MMITVSPADSQYTGHVNLWKLKKKCPYGDQLVRTEMQHGWFGLAKYSVFLKYEKMHLANNALKSYFFFEWARQGSA